MYPYNTPGAFVPHSAINLSVKSATDSATNHLTGSSLDLSVTEASAATTRSSYLNPTATNDPITAFNNSTKSLAQNSQSPQILDLTRPVLSTANAAANVYNSRPTPVAAAATAAPSSSNLHATSTDLNPSVTKEQTEPVDFSSFSSSSPFCRGSASADVSRFRSNGHYSTFSAAAAAGLSPSYNSLLQNGYATGYSPYNQASYAGCLNYANSTFPSVDSFGLTSVLGATGAGSSRLVLLIVTFSFIQTVDDK